MILPRSTSSPPQ